MISKVKIPQTNGKTQMWMKRAVTMHGQAKRLAYNLTQIERTVKSLSESYIETVKQESCLSQALSGMSRLANDAGICLQWCLCGKAWAVDLNNPEIPDGTRSGVSVCDECLMKHDHWVLDFEDEYKVAT
jgi:hypothetical protein